MKTFAAATFVLAIATAPLGAQEPVGRDYIMKMAGCFEVAYFFHEDGENDYLNREMPPSIVADEFIAVTEDSPDQVVLQHATIDPDGVAVPHWHEVWTYGDGGWTQSVFGRTPGDENRELRYRCTAPWSINRWQCDIGPSPKPFRDNGAPFGFFREDYEVLSRDNTLLVTDVGWVQSERNRKLTEDGELVSHELGYIIYRKYEPATCDARVTDRSLLDEPR